MGRPDKRVYIGEYKENIVEYYHDGNRYHDPGEYVFGDTATIADRTGQTREAVEAGLKALCEKLCKDWNSFKLY